MLDGKNRAPFVISPGSRVDNFFRLHPESFFVWANIQSDNQDLSANVVSDHPPALIRTAIEDSIVPFLLRAEMCVEDRSTKCGYRPLVGDLNFDEGTPKGVAEMLGKKASEMAPYFTNDMERQKLVLVEIMGHDEESAIVDFFKMLKEQCQQFRSRSTNQGKDGRFFQLIMMGRTSK